jgi:hypothetical protein
VKEMREAV